MTNRHDIRENDKTTAGGTVIAGQRVDLMEGRAVAYEGDAVYCPTCKKTGWIACDGERLTEYGPNGRRPALSWDLCICDCRPYPRLIASQDNSMSRT